MRSHRSRYLSCINGLAMKESPSRTRKSHPRSSKAASSRRPSTSSAAGRGSGASNPLAAGERALWKGAISFGLVQIPVSIVIAEEAHELALHQLDRRDNGPIGYDRINKVTGKKVAWSDIVKGYEISKGKYVVVSDEDLKNANVAASQTIDIEDFVETSEIPPAYFERPYHLMPEGKDPKAYGVLRDAMVRKKPGWYRPGRHSYSAALVRGRSPRRRTRSRASSLRARAAPGTA